ncbi:hypothetical protein DRN94_001975 [archaeon]|nr:hypothetical protein [archaeon]
MEVQLLAFDSFGARAMCVAVETRSLRLVIDPGVSLGPWRSGYRPHPLEAAAARQMWQRIVQAVREADVVVVTHYHYDHHAPWFPELYDGKELWLKDFEQNINPSQLRRARFWMHVLEDAGVEVRVRKADGKRFRRRGTSVSFSPPQPHGYSDRLGFVIQVVVEEGGERVLFTSDIQGPVVAEHTRFIVRRRPDLIIADGPPTYLVGSRWPQQALTVVETQLLDLLKNLPDSSVVLDHHLVRDEAFRNRLARVYDFGEGRIYTAAEFVGQENQLLEARRPRLFQEHPAEPIYGIREAIFGREAFKRIQKLRRRFGSGREEGD